MPICAATGPTIATEATRDPPLDVPPPVELTVEQVLRDHGSEIFGWLIATLQSDADADDAFSLFSEELWKSLARYGGRCSPRTWCYMLARQAVARLHDARRAQRTTPVADVPADALVAQIRETTAAHLRTAVKDRIRSLRAELDPDDQALLILRVDRDLSWRDIAFVQLGPDAADAAVTRHAAVLRKRFERAKQHLRTLAAAIAPDPP
jgi:RNA polymerase sigma-70 factor (ECF subfamily)